MDKELKQSNSNQWKTSTHFEESARFYSFLAIDEREEQEKNERLHHYAPKIAHKKFLLCFVPALDWCFRWGMPLH